jgi:hypothetical protein
VQCGSFINSVAVGITYGRHGVYRIIYSLSDALVYEEAVRSLCTYPFE